ncbi:MAG: YwmB family TATA-box binding protein [Clostridia bacterium]|nr:YwmB family TATA-box binding protein [Clostridia bacterium]
MRYKLLRAVGLFFALLVLSCAFTATAAAHSVKLNFSCPALGEGKRTYYLYSASSQAEIRETVALVELAFVEGESVEYSIVAEADGEQIAREILKELGGELLFTEEACGVTSYYAYAPELYEGIKVKGVRVNLQIAVKKGGVAVGSPMIFGGY